MAILPDIIIDSKNRAVATYIFSNQGILNLKKVDNQIIEQRLNISNENLISYLENDMLNGRINESFFNEESNEFIFKYQLNGSYNGKGILNVITLKQDVALYETYSKQLQDIINLKVNVKQIKKHS
ncbi:MAG: hypothetical protein RSA10_03430 [Bacilli bacterium]